MTPPYLKNLTSIQAKQQLAEYGANILPEAVTPGIFKIFFRQFKSPFIYVLLAAAILSYLLGQTINAFFILVVLILNAAIGSIQEFSAEKAAMALKKMVPSTTTVIRDDKTIIINTSDVVLGDLVLLVSGDKVPADIHLSSSQDLQVDESMLTGESIAADKSLQNRGSSLSDNHQYCYAGTVVMKGRASGYVMSIGANTEIGKIAADVKEQQTKPPLLLRIEIFTLRITYGILILITLIFVITLARGNDLASVFFLGVALAVSAIPEGLPAAITVALAIGMRRMSKVQVIIRNLVAVEALGSCTYVASDKTGTLTVNEMTIQLLLLADGSQYNVTGEGLDLNGVVEVVEPGKANILLLKLMMHAGILANESYLEKIGEDWHGQGDMVDVAFLVLAKKNGIDYKEARSRYPQILQIPYESEQAYCATLNMVEGEYHLFVKGSVETLLKMLDDGYSIDIEVKANQLAGKGYRVLGLAYTILDSPPKSLEETLHGLTFIGMVGMIDPLRPGVIAAVADCKRAGINVAMITGDHPKTALALAEQAGITNNNANIINMQAVTGKELEKSHEKGSYYFSECVHSTNVFARVSPHQKKQIIEQLMHDGDFVAVTGDGVNDAPALSHAHVGIAMGLRGTDVARESADIIITDDDFSSIVNGIEQGRIVYSNIRKVIFLLISTGAAEILLVIYSLLFGTPLPLFPLQLLWLNLVTNGIQDVALAFEPAEGNELTKPSRLPSEPIFNRLMIERVVVNAIVMGTLAFGVFKWQIDQGLDEDAARNITLLLMVLFENVHVLNSRSESLSIFKQYFFGNKFLLFGMLAAQSVHIGAMYTPGLKELLNLSPVSLWQWLVLLCIALLLIVVDEIHKKWLSNS
ncbi:MAG TPA: haloacid dehalogenase [Colwellia sp.]|nr:haloacid dehalogenase [Colwellia sp.]